MSEQEARPLLASTDEGTAERPTQVPRRQLTPGQAIPLVATLAVTIIVIDQLVKAWITERYGPCGSPYFTPVIGRFAGFSYVCNTGTAFARFQGSSFVWVLVLVAIVAVGWLWIRSLAVGRLLQQIAFGMIIGGAIGNMIDRARFGYVIDFVDLRLNDNLRFYVFNVADSGVSIGVCLLIFAFWRYETRND